MRRASRRVTTLGVVLIVAIGALNFHPPHFLTEPGGSATGAGAVLLEVALAALALAAVFAAVGIHRNRRWGWLLGVVIACSGVGLYLVQQTAGLPGLPQAWAERSRIVTLALEALFVILARRATSADRTTR